MPPGSHGQAGQTSDDPHLTFDTSKLEQTIVYIGQSFVQLLNAQPTTNHNLQNQSTILQQHQVDALCELTTPNYERNLTMCLPLFL